MSATAASYLDAGHGPRAWLLSTDHKRIGLLYLLSLLGFFAIGAVAAGLIRVELISPEASLVGADTYNKLFSLHGIVMVWFFLIPSIPAVFGNFMLPLVLGTTEVAFPRLNLLSWYLFMTGGAITLSAVALGGIDTGWTFYTPYSTMFSNSWVVLAVLGVLVVGFSTIITGMNFMVTTHLMRARGMGWFRLPLFVWSLYATSLIMVLATPVLATVLILLVLERTLGIGFFDPKLGGDPLLFQHLFWFYSHPAVYIMIVPGMGVVSELVSTFSRRAVFSYRFLAYSSLAIAGFGFLVWGHHMFVAGQSVFAGTAFSLLSFVVAVPSAIKVFNWTATLHKGSIELSAPMLYALSFIGLFVIGGLTGLFLASLAADVHLHDTYFVVAHFHYIMVGGMVTAFLGAMHYWWPKITGRRYPEAPARTAAVALFVGFNLTFLPQFILGYLGMPRRYHTYPEEYAGWHMLSSAGVVLLAIGYVLPVLYLLWSLRRGARAGDNPWGATGLEWKTASPPPRHNFPEPPVVTEGPYAYPAAGEPGRA